MVESNTSISGIDETNREVNEITDESKKRFKHFLYYFTGQQISILGSSVVSFALIWWLTITTQSEMMLGIASLVSLSPFVLVAPVSGILADRFNRKTLLIIIDSIQALITVVLSILFITSNISVAIVLVILGLRGTAQAFHLPVSMSIAPVMVPQKHLSRINGISYLFGGLINIIGPIIGAALLAIPGVNIGNILWIDVITFGIALIPLLFIEIPSNTNESKKKERESFILQITEGFKALSKTKGMIALIFAAMIINFFNSPFSGLLSLFVNKTHQGNEANYALVVGLFQAGIVIGGLFMSLFKGFKKPVVFLLIYVFYQASCQIALTFIPSTFNGRFWTIGSLVFLLALPVAILDVSFITTIQLLIPKDKIGRVMATIMAIAPAMRPLGQFLSGVIAEYTSIKVVFIVSAILSVVSFVIIYVSTPIRKLDAKIQETMEQTTEEKEDVDTTDKSLEIKTSQEEYALKLPVKHPEPQFKSDIVEPINEALK